MEVGYDGQGRMRGEWDIDPAFRKLSAYGLEAGGGDKKNEYD